MSHVAKKPLEKPVLVKAKLAKKSSPKNRPAPAPVEPPPPPPVQEVPKGGGYSGPLPTHEGKPVFVSRDAWAFYMNPCAYDGVRHERIRNYLMRQDAFAIAEALGRPLTVEDLKILVQLDGHEDVVCHVSGRTFRPMNWTLVIPSMLAKLREGKTLSELEQEGALTAVGHFIYLKGCVIALGGTPYRWQTGFEKDMLSFHSPITTWWKGNDRRWPSTLGQATRVKEAKQAHLTARVEIDNKIGDLLNEWKPGVVRHQGGKLRSYHH